MAEIGMRSAAVIGAIAVMLGFALMAPPPAAAQASGSSEAAEIAQCLCLHRDLAALSADMAAKRRAADELQTEISRIDAQLQQQRAMIDVNDSQAEAQFSQQLQRRDALFDRATGPEAAALAAAVAHYNAAVEQYNTQCANRPRDAAVLAQVQTTLTCPER
jgi:hypothetical protein